MVLKPKSSGQETAKARTQTTEIIVKTLFRERWVVLYKTGITTAVYLRRDSKLLSAAEVLRQYSKDRSLRKKPLK